ncbi:MAG: pentapeptide repeat-containing protein [Magnetococcales bacterium]|nr:pentapeptide repeat-containing protein [Magnetococcales bacterium]
MNHCFCTTKPIALWNREIQTDFKKFFLNLATGTLHLASHNWQEAANQALEALSSLTLASDDCETHTWLLIHRALTEATFQLAEESASHFQQTIEEPESFVNSLQLEQTLEAEPLCLDHHFFLHPERCALLAHLTPPLCRWLEAGGYEPAQARCIAQRLPSYFVFALNNQWRKRSAEYLCLQQAVATPFTQAAAREQGWNHYRAWLQKQIDTPLPDSPLSLRTLYVPLRGLYETTAEHHTPSGQWQQRPQMVDLHTMLCRWLHDANPNDAVRLLCGGAGTGKTTFAKMFAATVAGEGKLSLLFIPLHLLPGRESLIQSIQLFAAADPYCHHFTPLEERESQERLLLILDGLEEWAMREKNSAEAARRFIEEVWQTTSHYNQRETRLQVMITQRDPLCIASSDLFRLPGQLIHLLSYAPTDWGIPALRSDQRPAWWAAYGRSQGVAERLPPAALQSPPLAEISAHPLINHWIARGMEQGRVDLEQPERLNSLYQALVAAIFQRGYEGGRNPATKGWEEEGFVRLLEEVALVMWHGSEWTATMTRMESCGQTVKRAGRTGRWQSGSRESFFRLLLAFCFRRAGTDPGGEVRFAFLHHGFAQFMAARRIVRLIQQVSHPLKQYRANPAKGWDENSALLQWLAVCGPAELDESLFAFVRRELAQYSRRTVWAWQQALAHLLGHLVQRGPPPFKGEAGSYRAMERQLRHAELALLAALNGCARHTGRRSPKWLAASTDFGSWLHRLRQQRSRLHSGTRALLWLSHLDLSGVVLQLVDLYGADLQQTDLRGADLYWANLGHANLQGADLRGANLDRANLEGALLQQARGVVAHMR